MNKEVILLITNYNQHNKWKYSYDVLFYIKYFILKMLIHIDIVCIYIFIVLSFKLISNLMLYIINL